MDACQLPSPPRTRLPAARRRPAAQGFPAAQSFPAPPGFPAARERCVLVRRRPGLMCCWRRDRKSTRLNSSHVEISYAVFCLKKKKKQERLFLLYKKKQTKITA